jgi:hypothetical protein
MKKIFLILGAVMALLAAITVQIPVSAATINVTGENGSNNAIQSAINSAPAGSTISIAAGNYPEQLTITKSLTLSGAGVTTVIEPTSVSAAAGITRYYSGAAVYPIILVNGAAAVNIENLEVNGLASGVTSGLDAPLYGIFYTDASGTISGTTVTNVELSTALFGMQYGRAIFVQSDNSPASNVVIENNIINNYDKCGIDCEDAGTTCNISGNTLSGIGPNTLIAQNGIEVLFGASATIGNNNVSANSYSPAGENYLTAGGNQSCGILLDGAATSTVVSSNTASTCDIGIGIVPSSGATPAGTYVVSNNILSGNLGYGVVFDSVNGTSTGNSFQNNPVGLLDTDSIANSAATSTSDSFTGNTVNSQALQFATGSGFTATLTLSGATINVTGENGSNNAIQTAINGAPVGSTINIAAGMFPEQLNVTKPLTLVGAGATTIIKPTSMTSNTMGLISGANYYPIILAKSETGVNIENLVVDGAGVGATYGASGFFGIVYQNASGTISGTTVTNINCNPLNGDQSGNAIYIQTDGQGGISNVNITNNIISNYQKGGIICNEPGTNCIVNGNTVTGVGQTSLIAQNGIQVGYGATATVENNTISGDSYTGTWGSSTGSANEDYFTGGAMSCGILLYDASSSTTILNNTVSHCDTGICPFTDTALTGEPPVVANNNTISNNYGYGIVFDGVNGTSTGNHFNNNPMGLLVTDSSGNATVTSTNDTFANNGTNHDAIDYNAESGTGTANYYSATLIIPYTLTYTAGSNGSLTGSSPQTVNYGTSGTAVTAVAASGYHFVNWSDGSTANPRTDSNVTANLSVTANFASSTCSINASATGSGTISVSGDVTVGYGGSWTFSIVPSIGYNVNNVLVDGVSVGSVTTYTFNNVTTNHTISANFSPRWDVDGNHVCNINDIVTIGLHWNIRTGDPNYSANCDVNGDGVINITDVVAVGLHWGQTW